MTNTQGQPCSSPLFLELNPAVRSKISFLLLRYNTLIKSTLGEKALVWLEVQHYSPLLQGSQGVGVTGASHGAPHEKQRKSVCFLACLCAA